MTRMCGAGDRHIVAAIAASGVGPARIVCVSHIYCLSGTHICHRSTLRRPRVTHIHSPGAFHFISKWPNAATPGHWQARARGSCEQRPLCTSAALTAASCDSARALATRRVHGKSNRPMSTRRLADQLGSQTRMNRYKISIPMHTTLTRRPLATAIEQHPVSK